MKHITDTIARLSAQSPRRQIAWLLGMILIYTVTFYPLYLLISRSAITPSLVLVILAANLYGMPGGLASGVLATLLNTLLLLLAEGGDPGFLGRNFWFTHLTFLAIGLLVGYLETLRSRLQAALAQRQQVDESLQKSQQMLQLILDHIPQAVFWKGRDLNYLGGNREFAVNAGLDSPEQIIGKNDFAMPWLDQAELYRADDRHVLNSGDSRLNYEEPQTTPGGKQIWLRTSKVPLHNTDGEVIAVLGMYEDITERKQTEQALTKHNHALQALQQGALDIATELDVPTLLQRIMERAMILLDADRGGVVYLYDSDQNLLRLEHGAGITQGREGTTLKPGEGVIGRVFQTGESLIVNDYAAWEGRTKVLIPDPASAILGVPLLIKDDVIGVLGVEANSSRRTFTPQDAHLAEAFGFQAAIALQNARLYTAAQREIIDRKWAEEALQQSRERYRLLIELSPDAILVHADDKYVYANPAAVKLFGATSIGQIIDMPYWDRIHPDYREIVHQRVDKMREDGVGVPLLEEKLFRFNGEVFDAEVAAVPITFQGQPAVQVIIRDITERKRLEAELRAGEQRFRQLFEGIDDVILVHDEEANILDVNEAACRRLGYTREELLQMKTTDINAPSYAAGFQERLVRQLAEGGLAKISGVDITKDGRQIPVDVNTKTITYQGKTAILALARDITEHKAMEEALRESQAVLTDAQRIGRIGNWVNHLETGKLYWSDELFRIFGRERQDISIDRIISWAHPKDRERLDEAVKTYMREKGRLDSEYRCIRPDGEIRYLHSQGEVICDEAGQVSKTVGTVQDVTERRRAEDHRLELELERGRVNTLRQFIGDISHDLMTPITTMKTGLYLLGRLKDDEEKWDLQLERMRIQTEHLQERIQAMLNMLRLDATRAEELNMQAVDINTFVGQMADIRRPLATQKQQQLVVQECQHQLSVVIEEALLSTALSHLIDNAVKHTLEDGIITITMECNDEAVIIAVTDTGEGISEEALPHIFERFYRKESHRPLSSGVGLGLPIARRITELHGGKIDAESVPGQGSTFRIWLPKRLVSASAADN